jgi:hypothetical protein
MMADPEIQALTKSKRSRRTDPEEVTERIVEKLRNSREGIDKKLAKYNDTFMQTQSKKRQQFIDYCGSQIRNLPNGMRSLVATRLLASEDFAVEMNFSELHTSSAKSLLTWSCADASLSDPSWRTRESSERGDKASGLPGDLQILTNWHDKVLQQYAKGAAEASSSRAGEIARTTRATSNSSSLAPPSTSIKELTSLSNSMALADADVDPNALTEVEDKDDDILSTPHVTISKTRRARNQEHLVAPPGHGTSSTMGRKRPAREKTSLKKRSNRTWSKQECDTLKAMCSGGSEALYAGGVSSFWEDVCAQIPGRTEAACSAKWRYMQGGRSQHKKKEETTGHAVSKINWSREELTKLERFRQ